MSMTEPLLTQADVIEQRRELAEPMCTDTCTVSIEDPDAPQGTDRPFDEDTGQYTDPPPRIIYGPGAVDRITGEPLDEDSDYLTGRCRFQIKADINSNIVETTAGEREATYNTSQLQIPVSSLYIPPDAVVTCLTAEHNPALPGREFNIHGEIAPKSIPVIRRFRLREVTG
jgi:hypothetical protein